MIIKNRFLVFLIVVMLVLACMMIKGSFITTSTSQTKDLDNKIIKIV